MIIDEAARLSELVNDMLDISRIQTGAIRPKFETVNLTELIRDTIARYERLVGRNGFSLSFWGGEDVFVSADRGMILQVIYNLLNNAINYSGNDKTVVVRQTVASDTVRISVIDSGEGIDAEFLPHIWDRYYKVDKVHRRATVGTGLGLSIVKGVLELHSASYGVNSTWGVGSEFWFELGLLKKEETNT